MKDLKELVRVTDSISYLYLEKCHIEQDNFAVKSVYLDKEVAIPCASLTVLLLGPGTTVTHRAICNLSDCGCLVVWCGENLRKYYACGFGDTKSAKNTLKQAKACMDTNLHLEVVKRMYKLRFRDMDSSVYDNKTLEQLRGIEGVRMKSLYNSCSKLYKVPWTGRVLANVEYNKLNLINKAITYTNSLLYSLCSAVIVSLGYNLSLGFVHIGNINSFVYDIADLYKGSICIPCAFEVVSKCKNQPYLLEEMLRITCRSYYKKLDLVKMMINDIDNLFEGIDVPFGNNENDSLWNINRDINGKINYTLDGDN